MQTINGAPIHGSSLENAKRVADLIYHEGPLLSLFRNERSENLLFYWCDSDSTANRWLAIRVSDQILDDYLAKRTSLYSIVTAPRDAFVYVVDIDGEGVFKTVQIISPRGLPSDYVPNEDSFYEFEPQILRQGTEERIPIDGLWTFEDLSKFPQLYKSIYAFIYQTESSKARGGQFSQFPMRDGFSSVHFFRELIEQVPTTDRPQLRAVSYASPGAIVFKLNSDFSQRVRQVYMHFKEHRQEAAATYAFVHKQLSELKLLGENAMQAKLPPDVARLMHQLGESLCSELKIESFKSINKHSPNPLMTLKVVLAFYRRLERLDEFEADGKIRIPLIP